MTETSVFDNTPSGGGKQPGIGHNSAAVKEKPSNDVGGIAAEHLRQFIARIEKLNEEKKVIADDIKEVFAEAKGNGFDTKVIRAVLRRRQQERADLEEFEALLELYEGAIGVFA